MAAAVWRQVALLPACSDPAHPMTPSPDFDSFAACYAEGRPQVVWTTLVADLETPVSAMLKLAEGRPYSLLLESVTGGDVRGRYSLIGMKPDLIWRCRGDKVEINRDARHDVHPAAVHDRTAAGGLLPRKSSSAT